MWISLPGVHTRQVHLEWIFFSFSDFLFGQYLNSGAGGIAGLFFNKRWHDDELLESGDEPLVRLEGWWGHELHTRFQMNNGKIFCPQIQTPDRPLCKDICFQAEN
jgi:hypothetical protein